MNKNKEYILNIMKNMSNQLNKLFDKLDHTSGMMFEHPVIFFKQEHDEVYRCFSLKYFEMFTISFSTAGNTDVLVISYDATNSIEAYLADTDIVHHEIFPHTQDNRLYHAMIEVYQFFKSVCTDYWHNKAGFIKVSDAPDDLLGWRQL